MASKGPLVAMVMGSDSDYPIMKEAVETLKELEVEAVAAVYSAHRTPHETRAFIEECEKKGVKVFIAAAGGAAHLPGVVAAYTSRPVIGVPIANGPLQGQDALLAIVQMPPGVPVATVAINGAKNAALLAVQILGSGQEEAHEKMKAYREQMRKKVLSKKLPT